MCMGPLTLISQLVLCKIRVKEPIQMGFVFVLHVYTYKVHYCDVIHSKRL